MRFQSTHKKLALLIVLGAVTIGWSMTGCKSDDKTSSTSASTQPAFAGLFPPAPSRGGAELWADNCSRCHNIRPPEYYSDAEWNAICTHMRLRADLTGEEAREIAKFLRASN
jgi:hypothetical protein